MGVTGEVPVGDEQPRPAEPDPAGDPAAQHPRLRQARHPQGPRHGRLRPLRYQLQERVLEPGGKINS